MNRRSFLTFLAPASIMAPTVLIATAARDSGDDPLIRHVRPLTPDQLRALSIGWLAANEIRVKEAT